VGVGGVNVLTHTVYVILQNFIQLSIILTMLCSIKCNHPVNVYISLPARDSELQNSPSAFELVTVRYSVVDSNLVNSFYRVMLC